MKTFFRIIGVPGVANLGVVAGAAAGPTSDGFSMGQIYRSAQPEDYNILPKRLRIKSVLYLREEWEELEAYPAHAVLDIELKACLQRYADHLDQVRSTA